jgi:hypothetical protein
VSEDDRFAMATLVVLGFIVVVLATMVGAIR